MKTKILFIMMFMLTAVTMQVFGQDDKRTGMTQDEWSTKLGKPAYETTSGAVQIKAWVMTNDEHKAIKEKLHGETMDKTDESQDKSTTSDMENSTESGTHMLVLQVIGDDNNSGSSSMNSDNSSITSDGNSRSNVQITAPSRTSSTVPLQSMKGHYGASLNLTEKGTYQFIVNIDRGGTPTTAQFSFTVN